MKRTSAFLSLLLSVSALCYAQGRIERYIRENPLRAAGNMHKYEILDSTLTAPPSGFKPVYVSHFSRHGCRGYLDASNYNYLDTLRAYDAQGLLTPEAAALIPIIEACKQENETVGYGLLTKRGAREHDGIAERMGRHYPEVFSDRSKQDVACYSTNSDRVKASMDSFTGRLAKTYPALNITKTINTDDTHAKAEVTGSSIPDSRKEELKEVSAHPYQASLIKDFDWSRLVKATFVAGQAPSWIKGNEGRFFRNIYKAACQRQCFLREDIGYIEPFFTADELYTFWACANMEMYGKWGVCAENKGYRAASMARVLENIMKDADAALAGDGSCATLRFSHDTYVQPLACLMGLDWNDFSGSLRDCNSHYAAARTICMAGNIQLIFFRNKKGKVLVKILLNETETTIPGLKADSKGVFYEWNNLKGWFGKRIDEVSAYGPHGMYHNGWTDFNKNGIKDIYEDPSQSIDARVEDLLRQMTIEEKTCQMVTLYGYRRVLNDQLPTPEWKQKIWKDGMGAIDEHLNSFVGWGQPPSTESPWIWPASKHAEALNIVQRWFVEETRLGIPVDLTNEGIRGVEAYKSTNFPTQLALGCTWDKELINRVGYITGSEGRLLGYTNVYAPILDVGRDQRWGRYEEIYGEDPYLVAQLGIQMVRGLQTDWQVAATAKHFAIYSNGKGAREGMARCDPHEAPLEVENIHMYPWKQVCRHAGLLGAMSSYNDYNGEPIQGSKYWLTDRLRREFGFRGYVVSDSDALEFLFTKHRTATSMKEAVRQSIEAGLNVRCTFRSPDSFVEPLRELVKEGSISEETINERVRDILRVKFTIGLFNQPYVSDKDIARADKVVNGEENNKVALRASQESLVLLKNDGLLPLDASQLHKVAVVGPNADNDDYAHIHYGPVATESVTVFGGLKTALDGQAEVVYVKGCETVDSKWPESELYGYEPTEEELAGIREAVETVKNSDVAVVVLGGNIRTCGENRSRTSLDLPGNQDLLLKEVYKTGKPTVLVLVTGRPVSINWADKHVPAILQAFYPGAHGGTAVAQALLGQYNPGGKLTVTFPRTVGQIPFNFPFKPGSQVPGQTGLGPDGKATRIPDAIYNFGHGLSYTTFEYSDIALDKTSMMPEDSLTVSFKLTNTGKMAGDEIPQLYLHDVASSITVYDLLLRGFQRVHLEPGETKTIQMTLSPEDFTMLDKDMKEVIEPGVFEIYIGTSSSDVRLTTAVTQLDPANPSRKFIFGDTKAAEKLPLTLKAGDEITFELKSGVSLERCQISWRMGTDCSYEIQINQGGGQFQPIKQAKAVVGPLKFSLGNNQGSDLRIVVTKGQGTLQVFDSPALK